MFDDFDRQFKRTARLAIGLWVLGVLLSLTFLGVIIWAIIMLVQHFAG